MNDFTLSDKADDSVDERTLAMHALEVADYGYDEYSGTKVGAAIQVKFDFVDTDSARNVYSGCNLSFSGLEYKMHAEQFAVFNAIMHINKLDMWNMVEFEKLALHISSNEHHPPCGACLQVLRSVTDDMDIIGVKAQEMYDSRGNPDGVSLDCKHWSLRELLDQTYVDTPLVEKMG